MPPPKPRLVLRVGVSGHRPNRFSPDAQLRVSQKLDELFRELIDAAGALHREEAAFFACEAPAIRIISALAEGADRIVAAAGLKAGFVLDAIIPFSSEVYESDFAGPQSKIEYRDLVARARACFTLPGQRSAEDPAVANRAYQAAGLMTLRQCDLLIAVWDGKEAAGRGGTEDIVQRAIENGCPVLRFDNKGEGPFLLETSVNTPTDARDLAAKAAQGPVADGATITQIVRRLCAPPGTPGLSAPTRAEKFARARLEHFLKERERRLILFGHWYPLLLSLFSDKKGFWRSFWLPSYAPGAVTGWKAYWRAFGPGNSLATPIRATVMERFVWADGLANYYGQLHRSGYVSNYFLAAMAVLFAALTMLPGLGEGWKFGELGTIAIIAITTYHGKFARWHPRWLDYRLLSAQLRHLRALVITGSTALDAQQGHTGDERMPGPQWVAWYSRMTARELGVFDAMIDENYLKTARAAIGAGEIADQIDYHERNARRMHDVEKWLENLSIAAFAVTCIICGFEVWERWHPLATGGETGSGTSLLTFATVVLPAFGAALFGMRVHGDFEGSAQRSTAMVERLRDISYRLNDDKPMSFAELSALTENGVLLMAAELGDWGFVYRGRPLALPA